MLAITAMAVHLYAHREVSLLESQPAKYRLISVRYSVFNELLTPPLGTISPCHSFTPLSTKL
jgi:hypothetical protein